MEERYKKIDELLKRLLEYREPKPNTEEVYRQTRKLLKDLMAERGKMKELLSKTQQFKLNSQELLDRSIDIVDELECGDASEAMAEELRNTLTMLLGEPK